MKTTLLFFHFHTKGERFWPPGKIFQHDCRNCFWRVHWITWRKTVFFEQKFLCFLSCSDIKRNIFGFMAEHFWLPSRFCQQDCQNCLPLVMKSRFPEGTIFFSDRNINFLTFSDTGRKKPGHLSKISGRACQNCLLRVQRNISGINVIFEKLWFYLHLLGHWTKEFHDYGKIFWPSGYTVSAGLSKLPSTCPREQFQGKFFPRKMI